ncbi:MAG: hypothetical protein J5662_01035, partial [Clostridia bacterium]|nr:hypothetical protein [Clostridia bacterium]
LDTENQYFQILRRFFTFVLVCFAWIFFRANNTKDLIVLLKRLFTTFGAATFTSELGITLTGAVITVLVIIITVLIDRRLTFAEYDAPGGAKLFGGTAIYLLWAIIFAWFALLATDGSSAFIYFQF